MRGAHGEADGAHHAGGIIPADAGSTRRNFSRLTERRDHPRGCGEHSSMSAKNVPFDGSSPRMRGARVIVLIQWKPIRIIPADAGSTNDSHNYPEPHRDHPRGCGEHDVWQSFCFSIDGSSPRMRGAPCFPQLCNDLQGDHPRGCGEHKGSSPGKKLDPGSSPRMRGARRRGRTPHAPGRIIPADAGSTQDRRCWTRI